MVFGNDSKLNMNINLLEYTKQLTNFGTTNYASNGKYICQEKSYI